MNIEDSTLKALSTSLNLRQMRQEIISGNIANAETPGYKAKRIDFEEALARALDIDEMQTLQGDDPRHYNVGGGGFDNLQAQVFDDPNGVISDDGNTVNRDDEMAKMAENKILFDASIQLLNKKLGLMKYAVGTER
ncbi:MAG: flagellar basal body rod protein FlgB [Epsilonproteobacteria bacterium]|nr:MAG: flagellar basal body rod protein FlgB [Campylobacterota bacterium]RLA66131.1 MAG: flagellar basal body rod protein FlgB [Campylobacterota bacterium]